MAEKEYIEREAASRVLCDACGNAACPKGLIPQCSYYEKMQSIPAEDVVERKTGKWIDYTEDGFVECPFCHSATNCDGEISELHYCFNCGAQMIGGDDDV